MPRVLIVAATTGYQLRAFRAAAGNIGLDVTVATDRCHVLENPWGDEAVPVRFDEPEASAEELVRVLGGRTIEGVVAVGDRPAVLGSFAARRLGIPWHPPEAALACRSKLRMRELFDAAGLPVPRYGPADAFKPEFPCVLKPTGMSASRGVIRADDRREFDRAVRRIRKIAGEGAEIHAEQYIPGREFAVEGLMTRGGLRILAIFDKPDPLEGPFFEETIYVTPSREAAEVQREISEACAGAVRALGLWHGPIHAEMRVNDAGVFMLEVAARPIGGLCAGALRFQVFSAEHAHDLAGAPRGPCALEELILLHSIGRDFYELTPASPASGVMMIPVPGAGVLQNVTGIDEARAAKGIDDIVITAKKGEMLVPLPEGASYPGFIFASGPSAAEVEAALRKAHAALRFEVLAALPRLA